MLPLACFVALAVIGQALNVVISLQVETYVTKATSILVFFALFLAVFWLAWKITQWVVERRQSTAVDSRHLIAMLTTAAQLPILV